MGEKRIIDHEGSNEIYNDDWFLKDSILHDTKKVQPSVIKEYVNQGMATATALANEATARQNMDSQLASGIGKQMSNLADFYDTTKSYVIGDVVMQQSGDLLRCIAPTSGSFDNTKWESVTVDELFDDLNFNADAISYDNTSSGLEAENVQDAIDEVVADVDAVETALETKAEKNGVYDDLVAGNLLSDSYTADNAPYLYRQSPSASSVEQNIVGGTVAWNQQLSLSNLPSDSALYSNTTYTVNGVTFTKNNDGSITIQTESGGATSETSVKIGNDLRLAFMKNHIHYIPRCKGGSASTYYFVYAGNKYVYDNDKIFAKQPSGFNMWLTVTQGTVITTPVKVYPQVVDLEQMFGTTIANYVYTLESGTAGSGIAWLKSYGFLTKSYYAYQSGKLESVNVASRKIVGKNLFDEANPDKWIFADGNLTDDVGSMTSQLIKAKEGQTYILSSANSTSTLCICFYDSEMNLLNRTAMASVGQLSATAPSNSVYMYASSFKSHNNLQLEFGSTATSYEPYTKHTYPLDSDLTLRGIPKLDANNNLYYDGDIYKSDGSVKRRYGIVNLGALSWTLGTRYFTATLQDTLKVCNPDLYYNAICTKYTIETFAKMYNNYTTVDKCFSLNNGTSGDNVLRIRDTSYSDASTFKTAMNGVYLVYELATPTSESANAYENPQLVGSTEEFIDTRDVPIPVGGERKYHTDLKAKLEELAKIPDVPSANGTYKLIATRSASGVTYSWESN